MSPAPAPVSPFARLADLTVAFAPPVATGLSDDELLLSQGEVAEIRRRVDVAAAVLAAEIAHRSRRDLGYTGLATRLGARTPELLVARVAGSSAREAAVMVRVGQLASSPAVESAPIGDAVRAGSVSLDAADVIRGGLGTPSESISAETLAAAAIVLLTVTGSLTLEQLAARAREMRAELDAAHVRDREQLLRDRRYLRVAPQSDGMTRIAGLLDPESAAVIVAAYDGATSPRRGGPRFVDPDASAAAEEVKGDFRTTEQLAVDTFVELVRLGTAVDPNAISTSHRPAVRVAVAERDLRTRLGAGRIEGQSQPISIETVERAICDAGMIPVQFDTDGHVVNVGRDQRLFTARQRIGLAIRDGGCRFPGCSRPPSWCEAHHIDEWYRHGGRTDVADGIKHKYAPICFSNPAIFDQREGNRMTLSDELAISGLVVSSVGLLVTGAGFGFAIWQLNRTANAAEETKRAVESVNRRMLLNHLLVLLPQLKTLEADLDAAIATNDHSAAIRALVSFSHTSNQVAALLESEPDATDLVLAAELRTAARSASGAKAGLVSGVTKPLGTVLRLVSAEVSNISAKCAGLSTTYQTKVA